MLVYAQNLLDTSP